MAEERLGGWTLLEELGRDHATVWFRARRDGRPLGILHRAQPYFDEIEVWRRWIADLHYVARLDAPQIARVLDAATDPSSPYFVVELLEGPSLNSVLDRATKQGRAPDAGFAVRVALEMLRALEAAHGLVIGGAKIDLLHRDLGPWAVRLGWNGAVKVSRFGAARAIAHSTDEFRPLPDVSYMSPEVIRGTPLDARADVYSVGVLLWHLLAGQLPFPRSERGMIEQLQAIISSDVPDLRLVAPEVPEALALVVENATRRNRDERTPSARAMREAIEAAVGDPGLTAVSGFLRPLFEP